MTPTPSAITVLETLEKGEVSTGHHTRVVRRVQLFVALWAAAGGKVIDCVALRISATLCESLARVRTTPISTLLLDGTVIIEVAPILAFPCAPQRTIRADLAERTIGVAPTAWPTHILLAVFPRQTVGIVKTDLDADLTAASVSISCILRVGDAPFPEGALRVAAAALETDVPDAGVRLGATARVGVVTGLWRPHAAMCRVRATIPRNPRET